MTKDEEIAALLAEAAPLRCLPDQEAEAKGLPAIVDRINALRASPDAHERVIEEPEEDENELVEQVRAEEASSPVALPARRRGRPRKATAEGADA